MANITGNEFFKFHYNKVISSILIGFVVMVILLMIIGYQLYHRPLPSFIALAPNNQQMFIQAFEEPNLLPTTLTAWANKAVVAAYTFDFVNYDQQLANARPYFTDAGWAVFQNSLRALIQSVRQNQLFVSGVVTGPAVISNQGELPGRGYAWRIELPFLVTYQSSDSSSQKKFTVTITVVKVPTWKNKAAIGIDQFVM